ncbi:MAG: taurine ABC transporter substrate-binding protein, partial [Ruminiclostridium sp.]|nr:taurine ABC transporter substrate-binding protein [Ruminiclostridium sp.]
MKKTKLVSLIAAAALMLTTLTACTTASADSSGAAAKKSVTIGTLDLVNGDLIAQYEDWYTKELGVDVKLVKFDSGKDINSALASGSIDIGQEG